MAIFENITREEYNKIKGFNASLLKCYYPSTAHGEHKQSLPYNETDAMRFGTMTHSLILEPHLFPTIYERMPTCPEELWICQSGKNKGNRALKKPKAVTEWENNLSNDKIYYKLEQLDILERIQTNVENHELATELLNDCPKRESCVTWEVDGIEFKALIDGLGDKIVMDLKTCREIPIRITDGEIDLNRTAEAIKWKLLVETGNVLQAYHYFEGCKKNGLDVDQFKFLFTENNGACNVAVGNVTPDTMMIGKAMRNRALKNILNKGKNIITFDSVIDI